VRYRWLLGAAVVAAACALSRPAAPARAALDVVVTSAGDDVAAECPHDTACTLRRAIEVINADPGDGPYGIAFDATVFDPENPSPITILNAPLPPLTRDGVTIDGTGAGIRIDGSQLEGGPHDGLVVSGRGAAVRALALRAFGGACVAISGADSLVERIQAGGCGTGLAIAGAGTRLLGNVIGFGSGGEAAPVVVGVRVDASDVTIGDAQAGPGAANIIGNAQNAVEVGMEGGEDAAGVMVAGNIIGKAPADGTPAPVGTGVLIRPPASGVAVLANTLANAAQAGVVVAADSGDVSSTGNRISGNRFEAIGDLSVDLGANGVREPNDSGDTDTGPNGLLNHPVITRAVQSRVQGLTCPNCRVELYLAQHFPGGADDFGASPIPGGVLTAGPSGTFELDSPPLTPGQWITAIAIDGEGNTSEFAPSSRVGAGVAQCGDVGLQPGWNLAGFFGQASLPLGDIYPPEPGPLSRVSAIYRLMDGSTDYQAWFANGGPGRTLNTLESGEAYWLFALTPTLVSGGFSLTVPLPVVLEAGWNEFVYIGASADVRDALSSIAGKYTSVYRWSNAGSAARWHSNHAGIPDWAQGFTQLDACGAYSIFVTEDVVLIPLQP
jgi:hypothetical protein